MCHRFGAVAFLRYDINDSEVTLSCASHRVSLFLTGCSPVVSGFLLPASAPALIRIELQQKHDNSFP